MTDPRIDFLKSLNVDQLRIKNFPGFIFLCGGPVPKDRSAKPYHSLRHHLMDYIGTNNIELGAPIMVAETFGKWLEFDTYSDLMTFEQHLAGIANVIPIILESPGSIAELGAFSQEPAVRRKLLIFRNEEFADEASFINFALIKFIERENEDCFETYPWTKPSVSSDNEQIVVHIANDIKKRVEENVQKTYKFQLGDHGHVMILIEDLIKLMIGLRADEIVSFLGEMGIKVEKRIVSQYLFLLQNFDILGNKHFGSRFYFSKNIWETHIDYAFNNGVAPFDRGAFMKDLDKFYKDAGDKRLNASRAFIKSLGGKV